MKVDKSRVSHWFYLAATGAMAVLSMAIAPFTQRRRGHVLLYGHKLGGNLLGLYRELQRRGGEQVDFLTMDPAYHRQLRAAGERSLLAWSPRAAFALARAATLVSDHGLHSLQVLVGRARMRFVDVWHGIPFKGFDADDFRLQHRYDETWVASPRLAQLYTERFGFDAARVHPIGYARTDELVHPMVDRTALLRDFGLTRFTDRRFVLFAPTWKQDLQAREVFPFGLDEAEFVERMAATCTARGAVLLVRKHLNPGARETRATDDVAYLPYAQFPDTERLLQLADVLVCDWSSIAFDYLLLDRPTIFLDVEPPFRKGFSLGPEYRFGAIVDDLAALQSQLSSFLDDPAAYAARFGARARAVREAIYGDLADGRAARRGVDRLLG